MHKQCSKICIFLVLAVSLSGCVSVRYIPYSGNSSIEPLIVEPDQIVLVKYYSGGGLPSPGGWTHYNLLEISSDTMVLSYRVPYDKEIKKTELPLTKKEYSDICKFIVDQGFFNIKDTELNYEHQIMDGGIYEIEVWICVKPKYDTSGESQRKFKKSFRPSVKMPDNLKRVVERLEAYEKLLKK